MISVPCITNIILPSLKIPFLRSVENRQAQRVLRQRAFYVSAMTALKNRVYALLAQQKEEIREAVATETNIFSEKGQKVLMELDLARGEKRLLEALLKTYRHLETRIEESTALVKKLHEESREAQLIRTIAGFGKYLAVLVVAEIAEIAPFYAEFSLRSLRAFSGKRYLFSPVTVLVVTGPF
jgi:transposase